MNSYNVYTMNDALYKATFELAAIGIAHISLEGIFIRINPKFSSILGYNEEELIGNNFQLFTHPEDIAKDLQFIKAMTSGEISSITKEKRYFHKSGKILWASVTASIVQSPDENNRYFIVFVEDITPRKKNEALLIEQERIYQSMFTTNNAIKLLIDPSSGNIIDVNPAACEFYGYPKERFLKMKISDINLLSAEEIKLEMEKAKSKNKTYFQFPHKTAKGEIKTVEVHSGPIEINGTHLLFSIIHDITERHKVEEKLDFLAHHDPLTELPNKIYFNEKLERLLKANKTEKSGFALLLVGLDHFKNINDILSHQAGDELLQKISVKLSHLLRSDETIAKLGGDEYIILLENIKNDRIQTIANRVLRNLAKPFRIRNQDIFITASIGISVYPEDGDNAETLIKNADAAMYEAKASGRNCYQFYREELMEIARERLLIEAYLRKAIDLNEFTIHYQPQVHIPSGNLTGAEALLRWNNEKLGSISPLSFIPIAEEIGLIGQIGEWVLKTACLQFIHWQKQGLNIPQIAVNLSMKQLEKGNFVETVQKIISETGIDPNCLELEITESVIMKRTDYVISTLEGLRNLGIKLSIDDFGTGYSSLSYLSNLPVQKLKIDKSFVKEMGINQSNEAIVKAIIGIARSMGLAIIAEGVETSHQASCLITEGCLEAQGFLYNKPLSSDEFFSVWKTSN